MPSYLIVQGRRYGFTDGKPYATESLPDPEGLVYQDDENYTDGPNDLRYRRIDQADGNEWLTMPQMTRLLGRLESWVVARVKNGKIDAAVVRGSTVPIYRIKDRAAILREALSTPEAKDRNYGPKTQAERGKRKKKWGE